MGHLGLTPQSVHKMGGYVVQGKDERAGRGSSSDDARALRGGRLLRAGARGHARWSWRGRSPARLDIPTIGIGAGPHCDGQVLVCYDLLGLQPGLQAQVREALRRRSARAIRRGGGVLRRGAGAAPSPTRSTPSTSTAIRLVASESGRRAGPRGAAEA